VGSSAAGALDNRAEDWEELSTINLRHEPAGELNRLPVTTDGCHIWRTNWFDTGGVWRLINNCHNYRFWRWTGQAGDASQA
jgi:hypothetical protein